MTDEAFETEGLELRRQAAEAYRSSAEIPHNPSIRHSGRTFTFDDDAKKRIAAGQAKVAAALARPFD